MTDNAYDMVKASLAADSLALGVHWIYDAGKIRSDYGRVDSLLAPGEDSYHPTGQKGGFTHYGDQTLVLLESVSRPGGFDLEQFFRAWQELFRGYTGYMDTATKNTLKRIAAGKDAKSCGSLSNDIAGAGRIPPLVLALRHDPDALEKAVRDQTRMTHNDEATVETAVFFARVCLACLDGKQPSAAIKEVAEQGFAGSPVEMWALQGLAAADRDSLDAVMQFGQSCHTGEVFSGVVQIIAKYETDPGGAVIEAVMAGGDNAARAGLVAQVLAAYAGMDDHMERWFDGLIEKERVQDLLDRIP
ncbi:MAG: ADP-ribosylglycohydrolase family protein [Desulfobacterales bacterium]|nr:ADP-ribosylglycohydrolase family protein [Desulfobacterales bacterium]